MTYQTLEIETTGGAAWIWLNRPEIHNALDDVMIAELTAAFQTLGELAEVRAIVLAGRGKSFSAGADLGWMKRAAGYSEEENRADALKLAEMLRTIAECPKPVIARVQGAAFGGGVGLTAAVDIAVAGEAAKFCLSEVKLGLIPATIAPYVVAAMGERQARRYFLTAERITAQEARRIGLVHQTCADDELDAVIDDLIAQLRSNAPGAINAAKDLIRAVANNPLDDALLTDTAERIAKQRTTDEAKEGLTAFFAKRKAHWAQ